MSENIRGGGVSIEWRCKIIIIIQQFGGVVLITWNGWKNLTKNGAYNLPSTPTTIEGEESESYLNSLSANPTKWPNTLKQLVGKLSTNCLIVFDHLWGWHRWRVKIDLLILKGKLEIFFQNFKIDDTRQFVWHWKKLPKQVLYFLYIFTIYLVNTRKRQCSTWKHQKNLLRSFTF